MSGMDLLAFWILVIALSLLSMVSIPKLFAVALYAVSLIVIIFGWWLIYCIVKHFWF